MILLLKAIILSAIQGVAEWLPISSSGHLAFFSGIFGFQNLGYNVFLHLASVLAVIVIFYKDIASLFANFNRDKMKYLLLIVIALIPAVIIGILFEKQIETFFSSILYLGIFFIISGILVYSTKFAMEKQENLSAVKDKPGVADSIIIGIFQAVAILPGISRSGATISAGIFRGLKKSEAVKFSFLLAIPIILGAAVLESKKIAFNDISYMILTISFIVAFIVSLIVIKLLLKVIEKGKFHWFGVYNIIFGMVLLTIHVISILSRG